MLLACSGVEMPQSLENVHMENGRENASPLYIATV